MTSDIVFWKALYSNGNYQINKYFFEIYMQIMEKDTNFVSRILVVVFCVCGL